MLTRSKLNPPMAPKKYTQEKPSVVVVPLNLPTRPRGRPRKDAIFDDGLPSHLSREERIIILRNESYKRLRLRKKQELEQGRTYISSLEKENQVLKEDIKELKSTLKLYQHMLCPFCPRDNQALFLSQFQLQKCT